MTDNLIPDSLASSVDCPTCGAREYEPCIYVWPKGVKPCEFEGDVCYRHSDSQHERLLKVGTPTRVPHQSRKNSVFNRKVRDRQLADWERLRKWLADYGDIFAE